MRWCGLDGSGSVDRQVAERGGLLVNAVMNIRGSKKPGIS